MNPEEMPHTTQMNLSPTNMFKGDSYHPRQAICPPSHNSNSSHCPRKAVKKTPSSPDQDTKEEEVLRDHPSGPADSELQGPAPAAPTSQTGGPPQAPPVSNHNKNYQDPPECNGATNRSTRAPADGKGPGAAKARNKASEPHPGTSSGAGPATQPDDSSKNTIVCSVCGESGHWSRNCPYYNFCDFCRVTTPLHTHV